MTWVQRIKRVFNIDVTACIHYGGAARIVASIEEPNAILGHFEKHGALVNDARNTGKPILDSPLAAS